MRKGTSAFTWLVTIVSVVFLIGYIANLADSPPSPSPAQSAIAEPSRIDEPSEIEAWTMAQQFVKDSLKSPSTASFGGMFEQRPRDNVARQRDGSFVVKIWVDSQNAFGATVRTDFVVKLRYAGNGKWVLVESLTAVQR